MDQHGRRAAQNFCLNFMRIRKDRELPRLRIAHASGVDIKILYNIETKPFTYNPSLGTAALIAAALEVPLSELIKDVPHG